MKYQSWLDQCSSISCVILWYFQEAKKNHIFFQSLAHCFLSLHSSSSLCCSCTIILPILCSTSQHQNMFSSLHLLDSWPYFCSSSPSLLLYLFNTFMHYLFVCSEILCEVATFSGTQREMCRIQMTLKDTHTKFLLFYLWCPHKFSQILHFYLHLHPSEFYNIFISTQNHKSRAEVEQSCS